MQMGPSLGNVQLGQTLTAAVVVEDSSGVPHDPTSPPAFRIYGGGTTPMSNGQGSAGKIDTGNVTGATNATPVVIASAAHGLNTGTRVTVAGVGGNGGANVETTITFVDSGHFSLDGSAGAGAYTSGGTWHVSGLYQISITINGGDGYVAGQTYFLLLSWTIGGVNYAAMCPFCVV
jgi:hypothetical protein